MGSDIEAKFLKMFDVLSTIEKAKNRSLARQTLRVAEAMKNLRALVTLKEIDDQEGETNAESAE